MSKKQLRTQFVMWIQSVHNWSHCIQFIKLHIEKSKTNFTLNALMQEVGNLGAAPVQMLLMCILIRV